MFDKRIRLIAGVMPLFLGLGGAGMALGADHSGSVAGPVRCEISADSVNGMITLKGIVHADVAVSGSYQFRVIGAGGSGSSNIEQGGGFSVGQGGTQTLGNVTLGVGSYDASLTVIANGKTVRCSVPVGGI